MPIIKSAQKKLRQDKSRTLRNDRTKKLYKQAIKTALEKPNAKSIADAYSKIDKAVKGNIIHQNKAARLKQRITRHA